MDLNTLYYGDCLQWMREWDDESVDLIYLDPPFNSKTNYNMFFSEEGAGAANFQAFADTWSWDHAAAERLTMYREAFGLLAHRAIVGLHKTLGSSGMLAYLTYMAERLEHMHRILKPTGSLYLHCDPTASHYLKVVMDTIFGVKQFRNEIIWRYRTGGTSKRWFSRKHDVIFFYSKSEQYTFNPQQEKSYLAHRYGFSNIEIHQDEMGNYTWVGMRDVWDIAALRGNQSEAVGYPTQKPIALLKPIIEASSNIGDLVLDPFCGCGTTIDAARRLARNWVGIDISSFAIDLIKDKRFKDFQIPTKGMPFDLKSAEKLARENPFNFETWAITRLPGFAPNKKQVGDGGIDGQATLTHSPEDCDSKIALAQVKGGRSFMLGTLRDFLFVLDNQDAAVGCYISLHKIKSKEARKKSANAGVIDINGVKFPRMQLWSIEEYFEKKFPVLPLMNDPITGRPLHETLF